VPISESTLVEAALARCAAARLHLIIGLIRELETRHATTIVNAHQQRYTTTEIAILLDLG
jgi:hypothetical protein